MFPLPMTEQVAADSGAGGYDAGDFTVAGMERVSASSSSNIQSLEAALMTLFSDRESLSMVGNGVNIHVVDLI